MDAVFGCSPRVAVSHFGGQKRNVSKLAGPSLFYTLILANLFLVLFTLFCCFAIEIVHSEKVISLCSRLKWSGATAKSRIAYAVVAVASALSLKWLNFGAQDDWK